MTAPYHYWKRMDWSRRAFWKRERQAQKLAIPARLEDDYTAHDAEADAVCTHMNPCEACINSWRICCDD